MLFPYSVTCNVVSLKKQLGFKSIYGTESHFVVGEGGVGKQWFEGELELFVKHPLCAGNRNKFLIYYLT